MSTVVVVPLSIDNSTERATAWEYVNHRLIADGWPVSTGVDHGSTWCKAAAVGDAIERAPGRPDDVLVVHDADVLVDLSALRHAVSAITLDAVRWAIPHTLVWRLAEDATDELLTEVAPSSLLGYVSTRPRLLRWPYIGVEGGGCTVLRRDTYLDCPLDARFLGWGSEDESWGHALGALHGPPWRSSAPLVHLWHPHALPGRQRSDRTESEQLRRAYRAYRRYPEQMRVLVDGGR